jgi:phenylacetaldehyde dehydrogenase
MTITAPVSDSTLSFLKRAKKLLIGGQWVESKSGATFSTVDPATEQDICEVAHGSADDIDRAVEAARSAFEDGPWPAMTASERGRTLWRLADLMERHADELAELEALDNGKPYSVARGADVALAIDMFRYMAGWATKIEGTTIPISVPYAPGAQFHAFTLREPVGVVGQIIPWNFPLLMAAWKLGPCLTTGCTVVLKPAEQTPLSAIRLGELALEAGLPDGVLNIVTGFGDAGAALAAHNGADKVAFTGSTEVGKLVVQAASGNLKKVSLELGGKAPVVVYEDADLDAAVAGLANAIFFNSGQCCTAGSRLYVEETIYDDVVAGVAKAARGIKVGPAFEADSQIGPLVSADQFDRVRGYLDSGASQGAKALVGGGRHGTQGFFVEPTLLTNVHENMQVVKEEIFGPVATATPFKRGRKPIAEANDTNYGLAAAVWTRDISKALSTAAAVRAGTVWINTYHVYDAALPFGGYKESGWGREMGHQVLENYLETKTVVVGL